MTVAVFNVQLMKPSLRERERVQVEVWTGREDQRKRDSLYLQR